MPVKTVSVLPKALHGARNAVIVETNERGKSTTYPVSSAGPAPSCTGCTHVVLKSGAMWCYDNTRKIAVQA